MDWITSAVVSLIASIISIFPESPFVVISDMVANSDIVSWLPFVNWFIPIGAISGLVASWLSAVAVYYVYQIVLRWAKVIE